VGYNTATGVTQKHQLIFYAGEIQSVGFFPEINPGLTLWNKLGSASEAAGSTVGPSLNVLGSVTYKPAVYGNGIEITDSGYATFPKAAINVLQGKGTVEFWFTPNFNSSETTSYGPYQYRGLLDCDSGSGPDRLLLGWNAGGLYFGAFPTSALGSVSAANLSFQIGVPVHIALVWDMVGISGSADNVRLYINGTLKSSYTGGVNGNPNFTEVHLGHHIAGFGNANGVFDNLKIYNRAKTDFSDRFTE
ncbi:MAG: LamG domain-containing protein, partial [Spirochaetia bacterium]|nr:LamG domain-containing protein [Spirochaetia bacterium]